MRYYLDTNILIFMLSKKNDDISADVRHLMEDYSNMFYSSSVAVNELVFLYKNKKLDFLKFKNEEEIIKYLIEKFGIEIIYFDKHHFNVYVSLQIAKDHKDMNDHAIISQAIADKMTLISSDHKFKEYINQGLTFVFNKR